MTKRKIDWFLGSLLFGIIALVVFVAVKSVTLKSETKVDEPVYVGTFRTICLDGVLYWEQHRKLAVYIDKETLTPKRCEVAK